MYSDIDSDTIVEEVKTAQEILYDFQNPITDVFEPIRIFPTRKHRLWTLESLWFLILMTAAFKPTTCVIDNKSSNDLNNALLKDNISYQLVLPHAHCTSLAKRAIQIFKQHFNTSLALVDPDSPLAQWDCLIAQAIITLNILRSSGTNPKMSAHIYLFEEFDFNAIPLAPPGIRVLAHMKPSVRGTWAPNGKYPWYVGPSLSHYRCVNCYFPETRATRDVDTVEFLSTVPFPKVQLSDFLRQAAECIVHLLQNQLLSTISSLQAGDGVNNALLHLVTILNRVEDLLPL